MIGRAELQRMIDRTLKVEGVNDADALRSLDIDAEAVEAFAFDFARLTLRNGVAAPNAIAAAFAAGLELGVRLERERSE
jgi:hypothetical protein